MLVTGSLGSSKTKNKKQTTQTLICGVCSHHINIPPKAGFKLPRAYSLVAGKRPGATHARPLACTRPPNPHTAPRGKHYGRFHVTEQETDSGRVSDPGKVRPLGEWPSPAWKLGGNPQALPFPAPPMLFRHGRHSARSRACPHRLGLLPGALQCPGSTPAPR